MESARLWRKRVGVEPTIRPAKDRIAGFEGREDHRTLFASVESIVVRLRQFQSRQPQLWYESAPRPNRTAWGWCRPRSRDARTLPQFCRRVAARAPGSCAK